MHPYLPHLLADIFAAHRRETSLAPQRPQTIEEHLEEVELWVEGEEPAHTFGYYFGLETIHFPPADQLSHDDMQQVCEAFRRMMFSWNMTIDLPEPLPLPIAYKMMVDILDTKTEIVNSGTIGFDFCTGNAPDCIFKEYCPCLEIWNNY
ncbi:MAG: hypothetical protein WKF68_03185 [Daejeonella sp.]